MSTYITIGNSDDKLSQAQWAAYYCMIDDAVNIYAEKIFGPWDSPTGSYYQSATWACNVLPEKSGALLEMISNIGKMFHQDSVAVTEGETKYI